MVLPQYEIECRSKHNYDGDHQVDVGQGDQDLISLFSFSFLVMVVFNVLYVNTNSYPPLQWASIYFNVR